MTAAGGTALVTGVAGQDGSYLAELLLARGDRVIGTSRHPAAARARLPAGVRDRVELIELDLLDQRALVSALRAYRPDEIYNLAGYSSGAGMYDEAAAIGQVNGLAVAHWLEALREAAPAARFCQAGSSEIFGETTVSPQAEDAPCRPRSPYGAAKLYAHAMVGLYRRRYGLFACSAILYNHESPRRGLEFLSRKVTDGAARIKLGLAKELVLGNLEARRDWSFAGDTVRALALMLAASEADDYVVASGASHSVRELCEVAFARLGLDCREHVREDAADFRPAEMVPLVGNAGKARARLGWAPHTTFEALVETMVDVDLARLGPQADSR
jgi:GDPmannose 4,6-dehydratase